MQGYSRIRGSRSVDLEEPNWTRDFHAEAKPGGVKGSGKWAFNSNERDHPEEKGADPSAQIGFMLSRALSLKESMKQHKISHRADDSSVHGAVATVKRAFSMRKGGPPPTAKPCVDFYAADWRREAAEADAAAAATEDDCLSRSTSMSYSRIAPAGEEADGSGEKNKSKKKRGVLKTCKRLLLGKHRN